MARSQNGWPASSSKTEVKLTPLVIDGVGFLPGVRGGDVHTVLGYVAQQVNDRVEKAVNPGCWGYSFRANRNSPNSLSNHSSATAIDFNAPKHPNGVPTARTWSQKQIAEIHEILREVDGVVRWGGDYTKTPDAMHFEINADADRVATVAKKIRDGKVGPAAKPSKPSTTRGPVVDELIELLDDFLATSKKARPAKGNRARVVAATAAAKAARTALAGIKPWSTVATPGKARRR